MKKRNARQFDLPGGIGSFVKDYLPLLSIWL